MAAKRSGFFKRSFLVFILFLIASFYSESAFATTTTLKATGDASVRSKSVATNVNGTSLEVAFNEEVFFSDDKRASYVKFDISSIPNNSTITSAKLRLYQTSHTLTDNPVNIDAIRVIGDWDEGLVKWSNKPSTFNPTVTASVSENVTWVAWDVTNTVKGWKDGTYSNKGFEVSGKDQASDYFLKFASRESDNDPELVITYTLQFIVNPDFFDLDIIDVIKPEITDINVESISTSSARITWKTNEDTDGFLDYDTDTNYDKTANGEQDEKDHEITLYDLDSDTKYHYRIRAKDAAGNEAKASDRTFTTSKEVELTGPPPSQDIPDETPAQDTPATTSPTGQSSEEPDAAAQDSFDESSDSARSGEPENGVDTSKYVKVEDLYKMAKIAGASVLALLLFIIGVLLGKKFGSKTPKVRHLDHEENLSEHKQEESNHKDGGFTFIELLIVIAVLAVLSGISLTIIKPGLQTARAKDGKRLGQLTKLAQALETYNAAENSYPSSKAVFESSGHIGTWPTDSSATYDYQYDSATQFAALSVPMASSTGYFKYVTGGGSSVPSEAEDFLGVNLRDCSSSVADLTGCSVLSNPSQVYTPPPPPPPTGGDPCDPGDPFACQEMSCPANSSGWCDEVDLVCRCIPT